MPHLNLTVRCPTPDSFRVQQVAGMFGLPLGDTCQETFSIEVPSLDEPWTIGAIVGPSGSGKTTVARAAFGRYFARPPRWPRDRAVIDCFGERSIRDITRLLSAVGLSSPPAWIKPYHVLSTGERFRCDVARTLEVAGLVRVPAAKHDRPNSHEFGYPLTVIDEFTSVVDRTTARFASAAMSRAIRSGTIACRLVAVTCHRDILPWLEPDWVLDVDSGELTRGRLRRPPIHIRLMPGTRDDWRHFARHHYLSASLPRGLTIYIGEIMEDGLPGPSRSRLREKSGHRGLQPELSRVLPHASRFSGGRRAMRASSSGEEDRARDGLGRPSSRIAGRPAVFCAWGALFGRRGVARIARLVVLPEYQGVGIGGAMLRACCELIHRQRRRATITTSHPAMIAFMRRSPDWRIRAVKPHGGNRCGVTGANYRASTGRPVVSAEFVAK